MSRTRVPPCQLNCVSALTLRKALYIVDSFETRSLFSISVIVGLNVPGTDKILSQRSSKRLANNLSPKKVALYSNENLNMD